MPVINLTKENFQKVIKSGKPVLVDFWSKTCPHCLELMPTIDEIAKEYDGKAIITKVNVVDAPQLTAKYGIMGLPSLLFFKDGKIKKHIVASTTKSEIKKVLEKLV